MDTESHLVTPMSSKFKHTYYKGWFFPFSPFGQGEEGGEKLGEQH